MQGIKVIKVLSISYLCAIRISFISNIPFLSFYMQHNYGAQTHMHLEMCH